MLLRRLQNVSGTVRIKAVLTDYCAQRDGAVELEVGLSLTAAASHKEKNQEIVPSSRDTSSMSELTDTLWAVSNGDFSSPALSSFCLGAVCPSFALDSGPLGSSGTGESDWDSFAVEDDDDLISDRDPEVDRS